MTHDASSNDEATATHSLRTPNFSYINTTVKEEAVINPILFLFEETRTRDGFCF